MKRGRVARRKSLSQPTLLLWQHTHTCMHIYIMYIYIYTHKERERERERHVASGFALRSGSQWLALSLLPGSEQHIQNRLAAALCVPIADSYGFDSASILFATVKSPEREATTQESWPKGSGHDECWYAKWPRCLRCRSGPCFGHPPCQEPSSAIPISA